MHKNLLFRYVVFAAIVCLATCSYVSAQADEREIEYVTDEPSPVNPVERAELPEGGHAATPVTEETSPSTSEVDEETAVSEEKQRYLSLSEDIVIMSRLISRRMSEEFGQEYRAESFFSQGCEGFYVPDVGAVFVLRVNFPVYLPEPITAEEISLEELDPWEQEKLKLQSGIKPSPYRSDKVFTSRIQRADTLHDIAEKHGTSVLEIERINPDAVSGDQVQVGRQIVIRKDREIDLAKQRREEQTEKIEDLKKCVLGILGKYGRRISDLESHEKIIVVTQGQSGESIPMLSTVGVYVSSSRRGASRAGRRFGIPGETRTTLIISARMSDLPYDAPSEISPDVDWADIVAYPVGGGAAPASDIFGVYQDAEVNQQLRMLLDQASSNTRDGR